MIQWVLPNSFVNIFIKSQNQPNSNSFVTKYCRPWCFFANWKNLTLNISDTKARCITSISDLKVPVRHAKNFLMQWVFRNTFVKVCLKKSKNANFWHKMSIICYHGCSIRPKRLEKSTIDTKGGIWKVWLTPFRGKKA